MLDPVVAVLADRVAGSPKRQGVIAHDLFMSQGYLSEIVRGKKTPPLPMIRQMCDYFDLDLVVQERTDVLAGTTV